MNSATDIPFRVNLMKITHSRAASVLNDLCNLWILMEIVISLSRDIIKQNKSNPNYSIMLKGKEYPATHSMSTAWYSVDKDGNVGIFDIQDNGPIPLVSLKIV